MRTVSSPSALRLAAVSVLFLSTGSALAQSAQPVQLPDVTVTADRIEEPLAHTGSSVTIIPASRIERLGTTNVADVLRDVAGVDVVNTGGVGAATSVSLRGSQPGQTLVLIDGVRIGSPTNTDESVDFGNLSVVDIERIEVLRGPQSALYGSDAMGGVINIITRKGSKTPKRTVTIEGGSYGTLATRVTQSGGDDVWTYALGVSALHSDGFPRYGYRVGYPLVIGDGVTPLPPLPADDPVDKGGASARFSYKASDSVTVDFGASLFGNRLRIDNSGALLPADVFSAYNLSSTLIADGFVRATLQPPGSILRSQLTVYGNRTSSDIRETESCYDDVSFLSYDCRTSYVGDRAGAEYQGDLDVGPFGSLTFGARSETETASIDYSPNLDDSQTPTNARQTTNSAFAEHRIELFQRLDLTLGGRVDSLQDGPTFETWRATAAYRIDETGTKLRASAGTGAKAPSLFQRFSQYGSSALLPEQSIGVDAGIDQKLFNDRLTLSATVFNTGYSNLIAFAYNSTCSTNQIALGGCYYNVSRARTSGLELETAATLIPGELSAKASYTYLDAKDLGGNPGDIDAGLQIYGVPRNQAAFSFVYTGIPKWEIEPRLMLVDQRLNENFQVFPAANVQLAGYARLDVLASYKFDDHLTLFGRVENLTDADYQEAFGFGTAGRSFYAGLSYTW